MASQSRQRLSPVDIDRIWDRLRAGHAAKPTARALGMPTSTVRTYLIRWRDQAPSSLSGRVG